jgi:glycosyltransferase involved in cell wall biosynthesis
MKICILTPRFPFPENGGDILRINNIAKYLKNNGHTLLLITFFCKSRDKNYDLILKQFYDEIFYVRQYKIVCFINSILAVIFNKPIQIGYYFSLSYLLLFHKIIKKEKPDIYITQLLRMVQYTNIFNLQDKTIVDMADALSNMYALSDVAKGIYFKKIIYNIEKKRIAIYEWLTINKYKKCVLNTDADKDFLINRSYISIHPMGVHCLKKVVVNYKPNKIVFIGNMRTLQNQDAAIFFVSKIFPIIKKSIANAVFYIIGAEPPFIIQNLADKNSIIISGFVESVEEEIKDAAVAVAPVRIAAGIQNKVLISMACGIPVVLTSLISAGIPELISDKNCVIADASQDFSNAVISLLQNKQKRNVIGKAGYELVKTEYSWDKCLKGYEDV